MKIDISEVLIHVGKRIQYEINEPPLVDEDLECSERIQGIMSVANTGDVLLIEGEASTCVTLCCVRCLTYFDEPLTFEISEQFPLIVRRPGARLHRGEVTVQEDEAPEAGRLFQGTVLDLTEMLRQCITLALPMGPLHREDCPGLCVQCGHDLNLGPCDCPREPETQLGSQLKALLKR